MRYQGGKSRIAQDIADIITLTFVKGGGHADMQYQGGKSRIASELSAILNTQNKERPFISLFCGSCAVESRIQGFPRMVCNDKHRYLISMLRGVQAGYDLPEHVNETAYRYIREHPDEDPALTGFVGFGCSFGGKWFGGYARNKNGTNYAAQSKRSLLKDMASLSHAEFVCSDYRDVPIPYGAVIYADPPYDHTTGYNREAFDSAEFWAYARLIATTGHLLFVSEQTAPPDFTPVWEKPFIRTLDVNKNNQFKVTEKLFVYKGAI